MSKKQKLLNWVPIVGDIRATAVGFVYHPIVANSASQIPGIETSITTAIAKTDVYFSSGDVQFTVKLGTKEDRVQLYLNHGTPNSTLVGLNMGGAAYGICVWRGNQYEIVASNGSTGTFDIKHRYTLKIEVIGSRLRFFVDNVEVLATNQVVLNSQIAILVSGEKPIEIENFKANVQKSKVFVVMQFTAEFNALYDEVIRPVTEEFGFECERADDIYNNGLIIEDISRSIREASVIVADITPDNPNVFYEIGYSHGLNKPTILLSDRKRERLPFDVAGFRTLFYDNTIGGKSAVEERLRNHLSNIKV